MQSLELFRNPEKFGYPAHAHFWKRAISRRSFTGAVAGFLASPCFTAPVGGDPKPIPGGFQPFGPGTEVFHVLLPGSGIEPSTITDFNGHVGLAIVRGAWEKTSGPGPAPTPPLFYDSDMRFMDGEYVGMDGRHHQGTFAFI